jgi:hypothetical protein
MRAGKFTAEGKDQEGFLAAPGMTARQGSVQVSERR